MAAERHAGVQGSGSVVMHPVIGAFDHRAVRLRIARRANPRTGLLQEVVRHGFRCFAIARVETEPRRRCPGLRAKSRQRSPRPVVGCRPELSMDDWNWQYCKPPTKIQPVIGQPAAWVTTNLSPL